MSQLRDVEHSSMDSTDIFNSKRQVTPELEHIQSIGADTIPIPLPTGEHSQVSPMDLLLNLMVLFSMFYILVLTNPDSCHIPSNEINNPSTLLSLFQL